MGLRSAGLVQGSHTSFHMEGRASRGVYTFLGDWEVEYSSPTCWPLGSQASRDGAPDSPVLAQALRKPLPETTRHTSSSFPEHFLRDAPHACARSPGQTQPRKTPGQGGQGVAASPPLGGHSPREGQEGCPRRLLPGLWLGAAHRHQPYPTPPRRHSEGAEARTLVSR